MKEITGKKAILILTLIPAALLLFLFREASHVFPIPDRVSLSYPNGAVMSEKGTVIIDNSRQRILLVNADDRVVSVISADSGKRESFLDAVIFGDSFYLISAEYDDTYVILSRESVSEYSLAGKFIREVYSREVPEGDQPYWQSFLKLFVRDDRLLLVCSDKKELRVVDPEVSDRQTEGRTRREVRPFRDL